METASSPNKRRKINNGNGRPINSNKRHKGENFQPSTTPHSLVSPQLKSLMYQRWSLQNIIDAGRRKEYVTSIRRKNWYASGEEKPYARALRTLQPQQSGALELFPGYDQELFAGRSDGRDLGRVVRGLDISSDAREAVERREIQRVYEVSSGLGNNVASGDRNGAHGGDHSNLSASLPAATPSFKLESATGSAVNRPVASLFRKPYNQQLPPASANKLLNYHPFAAPNSHDGFLRSFTQEAFLRTRKASPPIKQEPGLATTPTTISGPASKVETENVEPPRLAISTHNFSQLPHRVEPSVSFNPTRRTFGSPSRVEPQTQTQQQTSTIHLTIKVSQNGMPVQISISKSPEVKTTVVNPFTSQPPAAEIPFANSVTNAVSPFASHNTCHYK